MPIQQNSSGFIFSEDWESYGGTSPDGWLEIGNDNWTIDDNPGTLITGQHIEHRSIGDFSEDVAVLYKDGFSLQDLLIQVEFQFDFGGGYWCGLHARTNSGTSVAVALRRSEGIFRITTPDGSVSDPDFVVLNTNKYTLSAHLTGTEVKANAFENEILVSSLTKTGVITAAPGEFGLYFLGVEDRENFYGDVLVCSSRIITCNGLPPGYKIRVGGQVAVESGGIASLDFNGLFPQNTFEVLDPSDNVEDTFTSVGGVFGGDDYTFIANEPPDQPIISVDRKFNTKVDLASSPFSDLDPGDTHTASQWQIDLATGDFSIPVFDSGEDTVNLLSIMAEGLVVGENYQARVRHKDIWKFGEWSEPVLFVASSFEECPTPREQEIADAFEVIPYSVLNIPNGDGNPELYWRFSDEESILKDYSGKDRPGTVVGSNLTIVDTIVPGTLPTNKSIHIDSGTLIQRQQEAWMTDGEYLFAISFSIDAHSASQQLIASMPGVWELFVLSGALWIRLYFDSTFGDITVLPISINTTYMCVISLITNAASNDSVRVFVNGVSEEVAGVPGGSSVPTPANGFRIGRGLLGMTGSIGEVAVWKKDTSLNNLFSKEYYRAGAVTGLQINPFAVSVMEDSPRYFHQFTDRFIDPTHSTDFFIDNAGLGVVTFNAQLHAEEGILFDQPSLLVDQPDDVSVYFGNVKAKYSRPDGSTLSVIPEFSPPAFTLETVVKFNSFHVEDFPFLANKGDDAGNIVHFGFRGLDSVSGKLWMNVSNLVNIVSNTILIPDVIYHLVITWDGSEIKFYINGQLDNTVVASGPMPSTQKTLSIGGTVFDPFDAFMNDWVWYEHALSSERIDIHYRATLNEVSRMDFDPCPPAPETVWSNC